MLGGKIVSVLVRPIHRLCPRCRRFSSDTTSSSPSSPSPSSCDVVQGPALLRTIQHRPRPTLLFLPALRSLPFWTQRDEASGENRVAYGDPAVQAAIHLLETNCDAIRQEYVTVSPATTSDYSMRGDEHSLHQGRWDWRSYMLKGKLQGHFAQHFPQTAAVLQSLRDDGLLFEGTPFGYTFFSTLHGQSSIAPHSAPMNLRLRVHLPLIVPSSSAAEKKEMDRMPCGIRVGGQSRAWVAGQALVLDDAYNHEVWNDTAEERVLLLVDLWHPDVTAAERADIVRMFQTAREQGLWSNQG